MRLFVAVWPPSEVLEAVAALPRPDVPGLRWTSAEQWHVTLRFLGSVDLAEAVAAFRSVNPGPPVEALMGPVTGRFGRRVLQVPVGGLEGLATATVAATAGLGQPPDDRPFRGHLTLARARERRGVDLRSMVGVEIAGRWTVEEVTLVASHPGGRRPARYEVVDRLALGRPGA